MNNKQTQKRIKLLKKKLKNRKGIYFYDKVINRVIVTDSWMHDALTSEI